MGRSGGGGGGRSSSGGFSGGGLSSGGFSGGGGRSSRSSSGGGRSSRSSFGGSSHSGGGGGGFGTGLLLGHMIGSSHSGGGGGSVPSSNQDGGQGGGGRRIGCFGIFVIFLFIVVIFYLFSGGCSSLVSSDIAPSTRAREALPASAVTETNYYTDEDGDWIYDAGKLEAGLSSFYRQTGVQPYVYILRNGSQTSPQKLANYATETYNRLFSDRGHFLLVFCDDNNGSYNWGYAVGAQAQSVMDSEAIDILADYLDRYYFDDSLDEEEIFSKAFADTGGRIMEVTTSPLVPVSIAFAVVIVVVVVAAVVFFVVKKRREKRLEEQAYTERILNTPLESFGDKEVEDLAQKYEDKTEADGQTGVK